MSPWAWHWKEPEDDLYSGECASREAAIADARKWLGDDATFEIIEARMSEALEHDGSDMIPFLRSRNHEVISPSPAGGGDE